MYCCIIYHLHVSSGSETARGAEETTGRKKEGRREEEARSRGKKARRTPTTRGRTQETEATGW